MTNANEWTKRQLTILGITDVTTRTVAGLGGTTWTEYKGKRGGIEIVIQGAMIYVGGGPGVGIPVFAGAGATSAVRNELGRVVARVQARSAK